MSLALLLAVVADKTGYPVDMLNGGMDLETDLGIDSIKRVEIFAAVRERAHGLPATDSAPMAELFRARTLDEVMRGVTAEAAEPTVPGLPRLPVRPVAAPACGLALAGLLDGPITVVDGGSGLATAVVDQLRAHGITATAEDMPVPNVVGVILLGGLAPISDAQPADAAAKHAFRAARAVAAGMAGRGGVFVTVQDTGGCFGLIDPDPERAWLGGFAALARTAAREWPAVAAKAIDCQRGDRSPDEVAAAIVAELLTGGPTLDVGQRADGTRWTLGEGEPITAADRTRSAPGESEPATGADRPIDGDAVLVVSGGARGVTAAALLALAATSRPRMLLLGRTDLADEPAFLAPAHDESSLTRLLAEHERTATPAQLTARARAVLARREVRATLAGLERAGATVRYAAVDVTDRPALDRELARTRREWGPVTGLVHGAGVLADKLIAAKTDEQFDRVYRTKVAGLRALLDATAADPLGLICLFSSVAARFGNAGQCDYAMANEVLNQVAHAEQRRRPSCRVRAIGWGPWEAGMVTAAHAAHFRGLDVPLIPLDAGARAFVAELNTPGDAAQVLITGGDGDAGRPRFAAEATVDARTHGFLADHAPAGVPVLPLAMAVEWFAAAGQARRPGRSTALADVRVLRRIELPDLATGGHRFTIEGIEGGPPGELRIGDHYRARLVAPEPARTWTRPAAAEPAAGASVYESDALFHGPRFQVLQQVRGLSPEGAEAQMVRPDGWPETHWWTDPAAVDGALQAAVLWARHVTGAATLPMGIGAVRVHRPGPATRCLVRAVAVAPDEARCDIALMDEDGDVRTELLGVSLIRRPR